MKAHTRTIRKVNINHHMYQQDKEVIFIMPDCPICGQSILCSQGSFIGTHWGEQCLIHAKCPKGE